MKKPTTKKGKMAKVGKVMKEFKTGSLHSGKSGKVVKSPKQAIAIALSEAGMAKKKGK
jgi:ribosomal protein L21E